MADISATIPTVTNTQTSSVATSTTTNGDAGGLRGLTWGELLKQGAFTIIVKGGPITALLAMVLLGGGFVADKHLTSYFEQQAVVTKSYSEYVDQSKKSDELLVESVGKLSHVVEVNTGRLNAQEKMLDMVRVAVLQNAELINEGSKPARETAELMKKAADLMLPVPKQREESNKLSAEILATQKAILTELQTKPNRP